MQNATHVVGYPMAPVARPVAGRRVSGVCQGMNMAHYLIYHVLNEMLVHSRFILLALGPNSVTWAPASVVSVPLSRI